MNESATEVSRVVESKQPQQIGPRQLREFDARLLQQVPDLSKAAMQHLIEHPEELRARLHSYGLEPMVSVQPRDWGADGMMKQRLSWENFYAQIFGVAPDFSRIYLPNTLVYTYITPVFVAPKLELKAILEALERFDVKVEDDASLHLGVTDLRSEENYIASFSETLLEEAVEGKDEDVHYRSGRMTLREYLLWTIYCLHRRKQGISLQFDLLHKPRLSSDVLQRVFFGSTTKYSEKIPSVCISIDRDSTVTMVFATGVYRKTQNNTRRVKLWESLPQI